MPAERADMATELLASLDGSTGADEPETAKAWAAEIERRARRAVSDRSSGEPWAVVRARVARRLDGTDHVVSWSGTGLIIAPAGRGAVGKCGDGRDR